jgi:hypothetical protein
MVTLILVSMICLHGLAFTSSIFGELTLTITYGWSTIDNKLTHYVEQCDSKGLFNSIGFFF